MLPPHICQAEIKIADYVMGILALKNLPRKTALGDLERLINELQS